MSERITDGECIAYERGSMTCRNGFVQTRGCWASVACWSCGTVKAKNLPYCLREELPDHFVDDRGMPKFTHSNGQLGLTTKDTPQ